MFRTQNLYQNDAKWANTKIGDSTETIGEWGGLLTSITMMLNGIGYNETPDTVNEKLLKDNAFLSALPIFPCLAYAWPNCIYRDMERCDGSDKAPIEEISRAVTAGKPVILEVEWRKQKKKQKKTQTHFVLVKDKKGEDYIVYDPFKDEGDDPGKEVLLTTRYAADGAKLESVIQAVFWFDFHKAVLPKRPKATKVKLPAEKYTLYAAEDGLVLRASPSLDGYPWKCLVMGTELTCLEPQAAVRDKLGVNGHWIRVQDPTGEQGYVAAWFVDSFMFPELVPPARDALPPRKKWCLKNVPVENPRFDTWDLNGTTLPYQQPDKSFNVLPKYTVVNILKSSQVMPGDSESSSWSGIVYQKTYHVSSLKKWVTTRVIGWVRDGDLDDYVEQSNEEFRKVMVKIPRQTESSTDAQQYFYIDVNPKEDKITDLQPRYNMCGELSIAFITGNDIDSVLSLWRKNSEAMYQKMVGNADRPLETRHMENLLDLHVGPVGIAYERYKLDKDNKARKIYVSLAAKDGDGRCASARFQAKLKRHYFITNLKIDTNTGDLEPAYAAEERNHWVVVDKVTHNGARVELYNPFPNRREEYSFGEFYRAIGGNPNSGWWIKRDNPKFVLPKQSAARRDDPNPTPELTTEGAGRAGPSSAKAAAASRNEGNSALRSNGKFQPPTFEVPIDNRTVNPDDAEQYLFIRGEGNKPKTKLCGEFSVAFILGQSLDISLKHWQEELKKREKPVRLWELATLLQAYGFNRKKYLPPQDGKRERGKYYAVSNDQQWSPSGEERYFKSFSIDTILEYWKGVQPDLYGSILGDNRNEPTGPEDLITILKAYGYDKNKEKSKEDYSYYRPGSQEPFGYSPGKDAEALKTHFLIAGVNIHGSTGRLQPRGVAHWVVVTKLTPCGNLVGGNGGWVELYNPFPNCWEEYSYREFMESFSGMSEGSTLWVKKDVHPVFTPQPLSPAKSKESGKKVTSTGNKNGKSGQKDNKKGKGKKGAKPEPVEIKPPLDVNQFVCERLGVDAIALEIGLWLRETADEDRFFLAELTDILLETGILSIQEQTIKGKKIEAAVLTDPEFSEKLEAIIQKSMDSYAASPLDPAFRVTSAVLPLFKEKVIEEIKKKRRNLPIQAYKPLDEFRGWTRGLASKVSTPIEVQLKKKMERLATSEPDQNEVFRVSRTILTQPSSKAIENEIKKTYDDSETIAKIKKLWDLEKRENVTLPEFREWMRGLAVEPRSKVYRVKRWGYQGMSELGFDIKVLIAKGENSNFQAVGLYNEATGFGAVSNYLIIPPDDVLRLEALQVEDDYEDKRDDWLHQKMNWLCQFRGSIYMYADDDFGGAWEWRRPDGIRWGTLALGGNLVQVVETRAFEVKLPANKTAKLTNMARLAGFKRSDWSKSLDELLALGLVHRCYCVYGGNGFGDTPKGIVYSPFWSLEEDWEFMPKPQKGPVPRSLWIPFDYLEDPPEPPG
jgi:hypothetical protein